MNNPIYEAPGFWLGMLAISCIVVGDFLRREYFRKSWWLKILKFLVVVIPVLLLFLLAVEYGARTSYPERGAYRLATPIFETIFRADSLYISWIKTNSEQLAGWGLAFLFLAGMVFLLVRGKAGRKFFWAAFSLALGITAQQYLLAGHDGAGFRYYLLAGTGAFLFAAFPGPNTENKGRSFKILRRVALGALLVWVFLTGFYRLCEIPRFDEFEATNGLMALQILEGDVETMRLVWTYWPRSYGADSNSSSFHVLSQALLFKIVGSSLFALRSFPVFWGALSVLLLYLLVKRLFGVGAALLSAFLFAVSSWHLSIIRHGMFGGISIAFALFNLNLLLKAMRSSRTVYYAILGLVLSFYGYFYLPTKILLPMIMIILLHQSILARGFLRKNWLGIISFFVVFYISFSFQTPDTKMVVDTAYATTKKGEIYPFIGSESRADLEMRYDIIPNQLHYNLKNIYRNLCVMRSDGSFTYPPRGPLVNRIVFMLAMLGIGYSLFHWKKNEHFFLLVWLAPATVPFLVLVFPIGSAPRHLMLGIPLIHILSAVFIARTMGEFNRLFKGRARLITGLISGTALSVLLLIFVVYNPSLYFQQLKPEPPAAGLHVRNLISQGYYTYIHLAEHERTLGPARVIDFLTYPDLGRLYNYNISIHRYYDYVSVGVNPKYEYHVGPAELEESVRKMAEAEVKTGVLAERIGRRPLEDAMKAIMPELEVKELRTRYGQVFAHECLFNGKKQARSQKLETRRQGTQ